MAELTDHSQPVDAITLTDALRTRGVLEQIGGPAYIAELASIVPTAANVAHYARIVHDKAVLRSLGSIATDIASSSYEAPADVDGFLDEAEHRIFEISEKRIKPSFHTMPELTRESLKILERLYENREMITGVPSGFIDLDRITAGFQPSDLVIIAARPSMGKTALALNIAAYAAMDADPPMGVAFFSLEMSKEQLVLAHAVLRRRGSTALARGRDFWASAIFPSWRRRRRGCRSRTSISTTRRTRRRSRSRRNAGGSSASARRTWG